jgi:hypothetical protein
MRKRLIVWALAVAVAALAANSLGMAGDGMPSLRSTYPLPLVILAFLGFPKLLIALTYGACFALWSKQLFQGDPEIPRRSFVLFVCSGLLSCVFFALDWNFGIKYQGAAYVTWCLGLAVASAALLILLFAWNQRTQRWATSALFHFVLFSWLCTYAMPYMGEMP